MCNICNGTHVAAGKGTVGMYVLTCPTCGPMPSEVRKKRDEALWLRIKEAERRLNFEKIM